MNRIYSQYDGLSGGKAELILAVRKAHGNVKGPGGLKVPFAIPEPKKYMGMQNPESLICNVDLDQCPTTPQMAFKTIQLDDITEYVPTRRIIFALIFLS